jgi:hypothetical protein
MTRRFDLNRFDLSSVAGLGSVGREPSPQGALRRLAILTNNQPHCPSARVEFRTAGGLPFDAATVSNIEKLLAQRRYRTALARAAFATLFDAACLDLDRERALRACLDNLQRAPLLQRAQNRVVPQAAQLAGELMFDLAPSEANRKLVAELCDERRFRLDRAGAMWRELADGLMRTGQVERAEAMYERTGMNPFGIELRRRLSDIRK